MYEPGPECVELLGSARTLASLRRDLFNDRICPDFFRLSTPRDAFLKATPLEPLATVERAGLPATFAVQRARLPADVRCFAVHRKARHAARIAGELAALGLPGVELAQPGVVYEFGLDGRADGTAVEPSGGAASPPAEGADSAPAAP